MKNLLFLFVIGYIYTNMYLSSNYILYPVMEQADWRSGIHLDFPIKDSPFIIFLEDETYMSTLGCPIQVNYIAGFKMNFESIEIKFFHECQHPIQKNLQSNNRNSLSIKYNF